MEESSAIPLRVLQSSSSYDTVSQHDVELSPALPIQDMSQTTSSYSIPRKPLLQNKIVPAIHDEKWRARRPKLPPKAFIQATKHKRTLLRTITAVVFFISSVFPTLAFYPILAGSLALSGASTTSYIQTNFCLKQGPTTDTTHQGIRITTLLDISVPIGKFSFGMARFIDLVWDVVISRGGQALLGSVTYRVYTAILLRITETQIVPYDLYASLTLSVSTLQCNFGSLYLLINTRRYTVGNRIHPCFCDQELSQNNGIPLSTSSSVDHHKHHLGCPLAYHHKLNDRICFTL